METHNDLCPASLPEKHSAVRRVLTITVTDEAAGLSIEKFMRSYGFSHRLTAMMKREPDAVLCNSRREKLSRLLCNGDILTLTLPCGHRHENPACTWEPRNDQDASPRACKTLALWDYPLDILYEDEDILVINKAAGVSSHPSMGNHTTTLANAVAAHLCDPYLSFHCITRLDKNTSGVTLIAKNALSSSLLSRQMKDHLIEKTYLAITEGILAAPGFINAPIARASGSTIERCIDPEKGDAALTKYEPVLIRRDLSDHGLTLLKVMPETGRTHQIRVHMRSIDHPIIGDFLYHPDYRYISRHALHAASLRFTHPLTGKTMFWEAPLPEDMRFITTNIPA